MKTILLSLAASFTLLTATAQYAENFEGTQAGLTANCWTLTNVNVTNVAANVITGTGSLYTQPLNGGPAKEFITPALDITSTSLNVSFSYMLTNNLNGSATRTIEVGLLDPAGNFSSLSTVVLNNASPTTPQTFNQNLTATIGWRKLVIRASGSGGPGTARLAFDDLSISANPLYSTSGTCNTAPVALNDAFAGIVNFPVTGNVISNDSDADAETITAAVVVPSPDGVVVMNPDGSFTFTPNVGFAGPVTTFTYQLTDNGFAPLTSNIATVTLPYTISAPLPVKLVSFTAVLNEGAADLKWTTSSEKDVSHFSIEKSLDGKNFSEAGIVLAIGNSSELLNYAFTDININISNPGTIYYRLRSIDIDGKSELSSIKMVSFGNQNRQAATIVTYPNPATNEIRITIPATWQGKKVTYEVIGNNGQVIKRSIASFASQTESININSLAPGFYIARVICNGETAQQKIIKR